LSSELLNLIKAWYTNCKPDTERQLEKSLPEDGQSRPLKLRLRVKQNLLRKRGLGRSGLMTGGSISSSGAATSADKISDWSNYAQCVNGRISRL